MKDTSYKKLHLIWLFIQLGESNAKLFNEIANKEKTPLERNFSLYTFDENKRYLRQWKVDNSIRLKDWWYIEDGKYPKYTTDENGTPVFIKRKVRKDQN